MRISAKVDYAVRAVAELASSADVRPVTAETVAVAQGIPLKYLLNILSELKHARIIQSRRGAEGGFQLARPADKITLAEVIRAVEGPLANVHEVRPEEIIYRGPAEPLREVWIAVRASLRAVLEQVTVADLANDTLPESVRQMALDPDAWAPR
ncbi:MAG TPA: transcriptional regulator [Actinobacteria bacterium]|nr:transcriptional regulator [Actinomycetota bacterium]HCP61337.1 transcriptional regulator [Actinomycetota bacterium]